MASYGYSGMPTWQKWLIYLVVGGLVYYAIYYFFIAKNGGYGMSSGYGTPNPTTQQQGSGSGMPGY